MNGKAFFQGGNAQSLDNIAGQPKAVRYISWRAL